MIDSNKTNLLNLFKQQKSVTSDAGLVIEYNMNSMIDGITVSSATADSSYTSQISDWPSGKPNPYKKLFPVDSIIKPFRPLESGIKYYVFSSVDTPANSFSKYRTVQYPSTQPRIYIPGEKTEYKYWLGAKNTNIDLTVKYKQDTVIEGNKNALSNKIVIRFEKNHFLPTNYSLLITKSDNTTQSVGPFSTPTDGNIVLNYNGTSWVNTALVEPITYSTPVSIKSIKLTATNSNLGGMIGVIELSARWVKDISSDLVDFDISKESSSSSTDVLPVGFVTANSMSANIAKYNQVTSQIVSYVRDSVEFDSSLLYLVKNAELRPFFNVYHSNATTVAGSYDKVSQGFYYINDFNIDEYGSAAIFSLDGSKYLMETVCPDIVCEFYPVTAIIRRLLDSIGFASYRFNLNATSEKSIPQVNYWWTDDSKTVWEAIQELCRDIQMNAFFDENNILQFYSRDYIYDTARTISWTFYNEADDTTLPNIISFNKKDIVGANYVKVLWETQMTSDYIGTSGSLWNAPTTLLSAGGLSQDISALENTYLTIDSQTTDVYAEQQSFYNFSGYVLIDSEIIEYDAMEYDCVFLDGSTGKVNVESAADINKYRSLCKAGYSDVNNPSSSAYFKPSGRYRIKKRGALGTVAAKHDAANSNLGNWELRNVTFDPSQKSTSTGTTTNWDLFYDLRVTQLTSSSVSIDFVVPTTVPTSYVIKALKSDGGSVFSEIFEEVVNMPAATGNPPFTISNLSLGRYLFEVTPKSGSSSGKVMRSGKFTLSSITNAATISSNPVSATKIYPSKSYFKMSNPNTSKNQYNIAYRNFEGMSLSTSTTNSSLPTYGLPSPLLSEKYYAFGTSIFLDTDINTKGVSAGLGFFVNHTGKTGYYVILETTKSAVSKETKSVRIIKADGSSIKTLADSQKTSTTTFEGVFGGTQYNVDVRVKVSGSKVYINAYINGFIITAVDVSSSSGTTVNSILSTTKTVALACGSGEIAVDYVYGTDIDVSQYETSYNNRNLYAGQYSDDLLDMSFGDLIYNTGNSDPVLKNQTVDDFGTVVREIYYVKTKLNSRPAFPIKWSTGSNQAVSLIGKKISNFEAEAYVLNNTSSTVPLSDGALASLYVIGNDLYPSGTMEYSTDTSSEYANKEPVIFESRWLQSEYDVKNLAEFIKTKAVNKGKIIEIETFGNPMLSVGDIVSVKYAYQNLQETQKMIITNVSQSFLEGISTSITCRTL